MRPTSFPLGIDITDVATVTKHIAAAEPDVIYHLAALAHVGDSWENPQETFRSQRHRDYLRSLRSLAASQSHRRSCSFLRPRCTALAMVPPMDERTELRPDNSLCGEQGCS